MNSVLHDIVEIRCYPAGFRSGPMSFGTHTYKPENRLRLYVYFHYKNLKKKYFFVWGWGWGW